MHRLAICSILCLSLVTGCGSGGTKYDLDSLQGKIRTGMSELEVTRDAGPPSHIDIDGDKRMLRYESKDSPGYILVTLRQNVVIDVEHK